MFCGYRAETAAMDNISGLWFDSGRTGAERVSFGSNLLAS